MLHAAKKKFITALMILLFIAGSCATMMSVSDKGQENQVAEAP